ncbi:MAG: hypothetical protein CL610_11610 [Anaerolineaceae bacterium]|nr:hypothetical protein [Anaerolineaceae bacterium]
MQRARRGWDWGLLLAIAFGILMAWPFIVRPGLPRTNASENFVFLTTDYSHALREGRLYPRWSPNVLGGFGAPVPHYFPPGAPYTAALIEFLFTNDPVRAVRITFVLGFLAAAVATYTFTKRHTSAAASLLATVLFIFGPYFGQTAPYLRGDLAEFLALALLPLLLWSVDHLATDNRPTDFLVTTIVTAALIFCHPPTAAIGLALSALTLIWLTLKARATWVPAVMALAAGVGLSTVYWLPALLEYNAVQWVQQAANPQQITLLSLFAPLQPVDLNELIPRPVWTLGLAAFLFGLAALVVLVIRKRIDIHGIFLLAGISLTVLCLLLLPDQVWLLGPISLCIAIGNSVLIEIRAYLEPRWQRIWTAGLLTFALIIALPVIQAPQWPPSFGDSQPVDQIRYEQQGAGIAVLPPDYPLPLSLTEIPTTNRLLLSGFEADSVNKIAPLQGTVRPQITLIRHETHRDIFQVQASGPTTLTYLNAWFPGWQAAAAGTSVPLYRDEQTGLSVLEIPSMNGELVISLGPTAPRRTGSWLTVVVLIVILIYTGRRLRDTSEYLPASSLLDIAEARLLAFIVGAFGLIVILVMTPSSPLMLYAQPGHRLDQATLLRTSTSAGLEALAYDLQTPQVRPGDDLRFTLYWQARRTLPTNYQIQTALIHTGSGDVLYRTPHRAPGYYPTSRWRRSLYVQDQYTIPLPPDTPSGDYEIRIAVVDCNPTCNNAAELTFFQLNGQNIGQSMTLPEIVHVVE